MIPADRLSTSDPGCNSVSASCKRRWATVTAAVTRGMEASGALMEVSTLWLSTMAQRISTSSTGRPDTGAGTKPCRRSKFST